MAAAALACGLFAALPVVAATHTARYDSSVTISFQRGHPHGEGDEFSGVVVSQQNRCQIHRTVAVRKRVDGPDQLIGTDLTNKQGRWGAEGTRNEGRDLLRAGEKEGPSQERKSPPRLQAGDLERSRGPRQAIGASS